MELNTEESITYTVIRRPVKRARLEYTRDGLRVIVPQWKPVDVPQFLKQFSAWIQNRKRYFSKLHLQAKDLLLCKRTQKELERLVLQYVLEAQEQLHVEASGIKYRKMKRQWGNCTSAHVLTFNKTLSALPDDLVRYIVYHEVCHMRSLRHGKLFKKLMLRFFPDIKKAEQLLKLYGYRLGLEE